MSRTIHNACVLIILIISACTPQAAAQAPSSPTVVQTEATVTRATVTPVPPTSTPTPLPATSTPAPTAPVTGLCSPLQGLQLQELKDIVTNPFEAPRPGQDDKHHGVDLAFYRHGNLTTMKGLPIQSALTGKVAAVVTDSKPYGNMVIIESPYSTLPPSWLKTLQLPNQVAPLEPLNTTLSCPNLTAPSNWDPTKLSLYLLYAHMLSPSERSQGESVQCGQQIGQVGTSGNSVNEHLHLEVRVGPSGATFSGLGHYDTHLTDEERSNYCLWRISGWFQMLDPMQLINLQP